MRGSRMPGGRGDGRRAAARRHPLALVLPLLLLGRAAGAQAPKVTISGGADATAQWYAWTVTNHHSSPIVYVRFPHYHADAFSAPAGWKKECTYLVNVGVADRAGVCVASVEAAGAGIASGRSAEFGMRISRAGARRRPGRVTVRFADGTQAVVGGVELPTAATTPERLYALIGFGLVLGIVVLVQLRRRRKAARGRGSAGAPQGGRA